MSDDTSTGEETNVVRGPFKPRIAATAPAPAGEKGEHQPAVLVKAHGETVALKGVVTIGITQDDDLFFTASYMTEAEIIHLLEKVKFHLLNGDLMPEPQ